MLYRRFPFRTASLILVVLGLGAVMLGLAAVTTIVLAQEPDPTTDLNNPNPYTGQAFTITKEVSNPNPHSGEIFTVTIAFEHSQNQPVHIRVWDRNPAPAHLTILSTTLAATLGEPYFDDEQDEVVWEDSLDPGVRVMLTFQMRVTQVPGYPVTNWVNLARQFQSFPDAQASALIWRFRVYLPLVLNTYGPPSPPDWHQGIGDTSGRTVYSVAVCPADHKTAYAGTKDNGVYKSPDGGQTWSDQPIGLAGERVNRVAFDPNDQDCRIAYAATKGLGVQKTTDGGTTWDPANNGLGDLDLYALAINPDNSQILYVGTLESGVYKSTNGGGLWEPANNGLPLPTLVVALVIKPGLSQTIYAGTWGNGVYKSTNGTEPWEPVNIGLEGHPYIYALAIDPNAPDTIYAGTHDHGVYRSANQGGNWTQDGLPGKVVYTVAVAQDGVAYAGTDGTGDKQGVYQRSNGNWAPMTPQIDELLKVRGLTPYNGILLAGTTDGVWWYGPD